MLAKLRNIGISAHVDSGKTTLTERILFYSGMTHEMNDVRGKSGKGAVMDFDEIEKLRGITISSACTHCPWETIDEVKYDINIIDTPGHADFTIEVERALRVLDGAVFVLCGVSGVQAQSYTVDRQMKRYHVPGIAFINKLDMPGAEPVRVCNELCEKLDRNAHLFQLPLGLESELRGVVDLLTMKAWEFQGEYGEKQVEVDIPADMVDECRERQRSLWEEAAMFEEAVYESIMNGAEPSLEILIETFRKAVGNCQLTPVFMGSAYKNTGVQPLLDAVCHYLPSPLETVCEAEDENGCPVEVRPESDGSVLGYAFKLQDKDFGQLTFLRIYRGTVEKGMPLYDPKGKKERLSKLVRMHANKEEAVDRAEAGDIIAAYGLNCSGGTALWSGEELRLEGMFVPDPVVEFRLELVESSKSAQLAKFLGRFQREDPTFKVRFNEESRETVIAGMGELQLDIYVQRLNDEGIKVNTGQPQVAYRETIDGSCEFDFTLSKQTGGPGMYAKVAGTIEPSEEHFEFVNKIKGGCIPQEYIKSVEAGFLDAMAEGPVEGHPLTGVKVVLKDGGTHEQDSSDLAFRMAAQRALKEFIGNCSPYILEPLMKVEVETPSDYQGAVMGDLNRRRGCISGTSVKGSRTVVTAEVPLAKMFGYNSQMLSMTKGEASFNMEFLRYNRRT
jgi:elongation factor G